MANGLCEEHAKTEWPVCLAHMMESCRESERIMHERLVRLIRLIRSFQKDLPTHYVELEIQEALKGDDNG